MYYLLSMSAYCPVLMEFMYVTALHSLHLVFDTEDIKSLPYSWCTDYYISSG